MNVYTKGVVNQFERESSGTIEAARKEYSSYWKRVRRRQVYLKAIFKKVLIN